MVTDHSMLGRPGTRDQHFDIDLICYVILVRRREGLHQFQRNMHGIKQAKTDIIYPTERIQHTFNGIAFFSELMISSSTSRSVC